MHKELPKVYDPREVEPSIYQMWMDNDCFHADPNPDKAVSYTHLTLPTKA